MRFLNILRKYKKIIFDSPQNHLLRIDLSSANLNHNIGQFKEKFLEYNLGAVLKSNAYGHGLREIGGLLDKNKDIKYLIVDSIVEAQTLRDAGARKKIIILGYIPQALLSGLKKIKNIILVLNSLKQAEILKEKINFDLEINIKIDTGMRRQGILLKELEKTINILKQNKFIKISGMLTHLADADNLENSEATLKQLEEWEKALKIYKKIVSSKGIFHFSATAGTKYLEKTEGNLIRLGIGLYGFKIVGEKLDLRPVLSFFAKAVNMKDLKKGEAVGYGFEFLAEKDMRIAILPCGYYEGAPIEAGNKGFIYFKGRPLKILGKISMNMIVADITDIGEVKLEDEFEIFSSDSSRLNSVENYAKIISTIPYGILCRISPFIKRRII